MSLRIVLPLLVLAAVFATPAAAQLTQTLPAGLDTVQGASASAFPFNTAANHKWHWVYDSAQFATQQPLLITDISVRASAAAATVAAFNFPSVQVTLASSLNNYAVATQNATFAANMDVDATIVRSGPWTSAAVPPSGGSSATWMSFGLTTPFIFDPAQGKDFIVQIEKCGTTAMWATNIDGKTGVAGVNGGNRYGSTTDCAAAVRNFNNNEYVPVIRISYVPANVPPQYQVNQANCALDFDGALGGPFAYSNISRCAFAPVTANVGVPAALGHDIALQIGAPIAANAGAFTLPDGQLFNLDITNPTMMFLYGGAWLAPLPSAGPVAVPFGAPPVTVAAQVLALDPTSILGVVLSQPSAVTGSVGSGIIAGPASDDSFVTVNLSSAPPNCFAGGVPVYGTVYTTMHVISNGRVTFGGVADTDFSPTLAEALLDQPFFGLWADMNPAMIGSTGALGSVSITMPAAGTYRVAYSAIPYFVQATTSNSYALIIDTAGIVQLDGLSGVVLHPVATSLMFTGISAGLTGATDPGAAAFAVGGPNAGPAGLGMIYAFGQAGLATQGLNNITFVPNMTGNYDWLAN